MNDQKRLVCSNHPGQRVYLEPAGETDDNVRCPECGQTWPNYLKYPVAQVIDLTTGEIHCQNVLTGEKHTPTGP